MVHGEGEGGGRGAFGEGIFAGGAGEGGEGDGIGPVSGGDRGDLHFEFHSHGDGVGRMVRGVKFYRENIPAGRLVRDGIRRTIRLGDR